MITIGLFAAFEGVCVEFEKVGDCKNEPLLHKNFRIKDLLL